MQKIGSLTNTADVNGEFTDGSGASAVESTLLPAAWFNTIQRELVNIVQSGGLTLDPNNDKQVLTALRAIFPYITTQGHNANGYWRVWSDGTYELWGASDTTDSSTGKSVVTFPIALPFSTRMIYTQQLTSGAPANLVGTQLDDTTRTATGFVCYTKDSLGNAIAAGFIWHAICKA